MVTDFRANGRCLARTEREGQRGTALFIVLVVLTILSAAGVYASRAAGLSQRSAGYERQASQTGYVSEYATATIISQLVSYWPVIQANMMAAVNGSAYSSCPYNLGDSGLQVPCASYNITTLQSWVTASGGISSLFDTLGGSLAAPAASNPTLQAIYQLEFTDIGPAGLAIPGVQVDGKGAGATTKQFTITSVANVTTWYTPGTACSSTPQAQAAAQYGGSHRMRSIVKQPSYR